MSEYENGRPGWGGREISTAIKTTSSVGRDEVHVADLRADYVVRCSRCHHPLTAERSIEIELGPVCRKAVAA